MLNMNLIKDEIKVNSKVKETRRCKNPRCITSTEFNAPKLFYVSDKKKDEYRCEYCDEVYTA